MKGGNFPSGAHGVLSSMVEGFLSALWWLLRRHGRESTTREPLQEITSSANCSVAPSLYAGRERPCAKGGCSRGQAIGAAGAFVRRKRVCRVHVLPRCRSCMSGKAVMGPAYKWDVKDSKDP